MHDFWLGGGHNTAADRALAEKIRAVMPAIEDIARLNQSFLRRATLHMIESGINQFLDIGSGVPMIGELSELIQRADADCRLLYVEGDPVALALAELLLTGTGRSAVIQADPRDADGVLDAELTRRVLDVGKPICLIAPMLHFLPDSSDAARMLAAYGDRLASGSGLVALHVTTDSNAPGLAEAIEVYRTTPFQVYPRSRAEFARMCAGFDLLEPGLVGYADWRPQGPSDVSTDPAINTAIYAAVGRKP
jgi:hypothetical protein